MIPQSASTSLRTVSRRGLPLSRSHRGVTMRRTTHVHRRHISSEALAPPSRAPLLLAAAVGSGVLGYSAPHNLSGVYLLCLSIY